MLIEKIKNILGQDKCKNLVFYFDADGSFKDELQEIEEAGIQVISVSNNYFELKYQLEIELQGKEFFLYHPIAKPNEQEIKKYPLLDLLKANHELRLDDASEFLSEYGLQEYHLPLVKRYIKQLKTKTNQKKLGRILDGSHFNEANLKLGLISITLDFHSVVDKNSCIAKCLALANDEKAFYKAIKSLVELELDQEVLGWFNYLLDTNFQDLNRENIIELARKLKYNVLTAFIDKTVKTDSYNKLKLQRSADINRLQSFFQDWESHPNLKSQIEQVFNQLAADIKTANLMAWYGSEYEFGYYSEDMLTSMIRELYKTALENPVKTKDECIKWLRNNTLSEDQKEQVKFIYHTTGVYAILEGYKSFKFNKAEDFIKEYTAELHLVDYNYRKAVIAFDKVRDRLYEFEDEASSVFNTLNQKYDRFLIEINVEWQQALNDQKFNYHHLDVDKQFDFYNKNLRSFDYKIVVIISDALRYELGNELFNDLLSDSKNDLTIEPALTSIPSYTNLGMSNILPNSGIDVEQAENDLNFQIDGISTSSVNREKILKNVETDSAAIPFSKFKPLSRSEKNQILKDNKQLYIYHNWQDNIGDTRATEYEAFDAGEKTLNDLKWLVKTLTSEDRVRYVIITSDHGYIYNHNVIDEKSKETFPKTKGYSVKHNRFIVAEEFSESVDGYEFPLRNTTNINTDLKVAIPRAINRFKQSGHGHQFVHGGGSIQEVLTPVIKFYKHKKDTHELVTFKRIDQTDKIASGSLKIALIQDQPVSNDYKSAELIFGVYSDTGELLTNELELHLNSTSSNPKERLFEVILSLNSQGSKASFGYLKAFDKKDKTRLNPLVVNDLIKISSLMEKDEF